MMPCDLVQLIIERAYAGEKDHVKHALDLFVDFAAIFVRILVRSVSEAVEVLRVHMYSCIATMRCSIGASGFVLLLHIWSMATTWNASAGDPHPEAAARGGSASS